jgi:two-component system response regulator YesN
VQKAMKLGVTDYIVKLTMSSDEMYSVLRKAKSKLDVTKRIATSIDTIPLTGKQYQESVQKIIGNFLFYDIYSETDFKSVVGTRIMPPKMILSVMETDHFKQYQKKFDDEQGDLIRLSIINIVDEILEGYKIGLVIADTNKRFVLIFSFDNHPDTNGIEGYYAALYEILEHIQRTLSNYLSISVTFAVSKLKDDYKQLNKMYTECKEAILHKFILGTGIIIRSHHTDKAALLKVKVEKINLLLTVLKDHPPFIHEELMRMIASNDLSKDTIQDQFVNLIVTIFSKTSSCDTLSLYADMNKYKNEILAYESLNEIIDTVKTLLNEMVHFDNNYNRYSKEIQQLVKFIHKHYAEKITVEQLASMINYSPNYLCTIFKKETNTNLTEYINSKRIDAAKKLLTGTNLRNYEIAQKVGFTNESYFANLFNKITGMTPYEYKKLQR